MRPGTFFLIVGPSGAGKDSLIDGARALLEPTGRYVFARRVVTRPAGSPGEDHEAATDEAFDAREAKGDFLITWGAHGLRYGLPAELKRLVEAGRNVIANGSRATIAALAGRLPRFVVVEVTAPPEVLAARIAGRGRESGEAIEKRLSRTVEPRPEGIRAATICNDQSVEIGIERFIAAVEAAANTMRLRRLPLFAGRAHCAYLPAKGEIVNGFDYLGPGRVEISGATASTRSDVQVIDLPSLLAGDEIGLSAEAFDELGLPEGSEVTLRRTPSPESRAALTRKIQGGELTEEQYHTLIRDIVEARYPDGEVAAFLVAATQKLTDDEVVALARVRSRFAQTITWPDRIVVDKHSMGGIPGSRITLIVVPIVAAHGAFLMPKTSSRAITSAAGTADAMEALARVELNPAELRACVEKARGCIAWNGRLNHSVVDDVMNAITRPLGIDSNRWSVASILSKKLTAGSTHVIVDLPYGPRAKLKSEAEAAELAQLFETVGAGLGLVVNAFPTDGSRPIGRGIGPALECRDVGWVLDNDPQAPADLVEKALFFASRILAWDPALGSAAAGRERAEGLLRSGAARAAFERIIDAQGRREPPVAPGLLVHTVRSPTAGTVTEIDGWAVAGIARRAGAPFDKAAGIDLRRHVGDAVAVGDPLFAIHASASSDLDEAKAMAESCDCYVIG
ncbi:putative Ribose 1,5-bisphosphate phosphokinase PhnN / thymidine phosphorylase [Bosea sp. 62]|uniref:phosphonate metabolism protein/1,5-bisphosphokinase (PRPP-forming) PhnN n=1 Tax=unclassified Bosea (in: a-proteobacteria) TaxID=2653178 RepID=UPI001259C1BA|nr:MULTISPECIES: phosphonate metabolism protein/1,5-bisphosphokinase (PRPP-forming) PhnN [unclassified Bosea (in: a-proteobacteria)]CAD5286326.1 putative Ribose 1,5-bisphosphate phosphokinase PhnN / thymidine phosphorylase [Bosea sp. 21B]CAD5288925.1 putative Ribose 1,5-bisphosphate phosphokinase PhnN / thymidine phosphorylase [Bosea sp. 46]CAD5301296.1 putative Ribose 1,5-bisphosphate phosphokinase PhnN / thymidine phosphorylase [Bosea sp. 7B]VVT60576.1 putative Ribose 1,5-bisphosphate phospho